jgi:HlyD family secretion protein
MCSAKLRDTHADAAGGDRGGNSAARAMRKTAPGGRRWPRLQTETQEAISGRSVEARASPMRRLILPALVAVVLLGAVGYYFFGSGQSAVTYRLAPVETGPIVSIVSAAGTVELSTSVPVVAQTPGEVVEIMATYNAPVKAGDVLARLDPTAALARLEMARADLNVASGAIAIASSQIELARRQVENALASLESARATAQAAELAVKDAERDLGISRQLAATGDAARMETERAKSTRGRAGTDLAAAKARETAAVASYDAAQAQLEVSQTQLTNARETLAAREIAVRQAEQDLEYTTIRAPVDGVVMAKDIVERQLVNNGQMLFTLAEDLSKIEVHARIDEADIGRIASGQSASFGFSAFPGRAFQGQVADIRRMPQVAEGIVTYVAVIVADNHDLVLLPGMTAEIRIIVDQRDNVLKVPKSALRFTPPSPDGKVAAVAEHAAGGERVWKLSGGNPKAVPVRTGVSDGVYTEITEGDLKVGQEIIVGAFQADAAQSAGRSRP